MDSLNKIREQIDCMAEDLSKEAYKQYVINPHTRLYLYISTEDNPRKVIISQDAKPGTILAENETVPRNRTVDGLKAWMIDRLQKLPIIKT